MSKEAVNVETGEVMLLPAKYDAKEYLASLSKSDGIAVQQQLAAAYDAAVTALVGPNDVQVEGNRSFKKKSAWRKLARYFNISVDIVKVEREMLGDKFLATVTARAVAPWGQHYEEIGSCCTDEATGRRVITVADAIATASTRASNRAVSNLIAMGEVSAEEIGDRKSYDSAPARPASSAPRAPSEPGKATMPFGKTKGQLLTALKTEEIESALKWAKEKGKFVEFQSDAEAELARRRGSLGTAPELPEPELPDHDDDLPF